ncbi:MAG: phosphoribosylaminoimidazolesuccinocarboxamide synthase [bacterium]
MRESLFPKLKLVKKGKVRDVYEIGEGLLIVATDRISAFDVVLPTTIPYKGEILNQLSLFWFDRFKDVVENHIITADVNGYPTVPEEYKDALKYRSVYVKKAEPILVECIVRGYISGSGWKEYRKSGTVCGIKLEENLNESDKLSEPIFTPSTKAEQGEHDENISFEKMKDIVGSEVANTLKELSIKLYQAASDYAYSKGIIIADTKLEFGFYNGKIILIDEIFTPDSSRFWPLESYTPGTSQVSLDKQYIRDYLLEIDWQKMDKLPELPYDVVQKTFHKYKKAYEVLTGRKFRISEI